MPELNVQNGVLKALSFLFEYIGEMGKDYIYAVSPLLEDALMDRDLVSILWLRKKSHFPLHSPYPVICRSPGVPVDIGLQCSRNS